MADGKPLTVKEGIAQLQAALAAGDLQPDDWLVLQTDPEGNGFWPIVEVAPGLYEPGERCSGGDMWIPPGYFNGTEFVPHNPDEPPPAHVKPCAVFVPGYNPRPAS